ncbi:hypothetical protein GP486_008032 [Trichoglossum hirsutum]|uniref:Uncharacterized protein n=1 Tax=Trichoglossum hirsutum TaxID=265104 RepID=A0A9P8I5A2_9PEZI|nr:hypothetical protein GP486_008032 [Trichoglossum hirsutum]
MSGVTYQTPDLASVLRTLASLAPPQQPPQTGQQPPAPPLAVPEGPPTSQQEESELEEGEYEPPDSLSEIPTSPTSSLTNTSEANSATSGQQSRDPRLHPVDAVPRPPPTKKAVDGPPPIDATSITDWSAGLKCVMKTVAQSDAIMARIKKTPEQDAQELRTYETKVYKASVEMAKAMSSELKSLGVPFFGTRSTLVRGKYSGSTAGDPVGGKGAAEGIDGKVSEQELIILQKRMLELLEDLCR